MSPEELRKRLEELRARMHPNMPIYEWSMTALELTRLMIDALEEYAKERAARGEP